MGRLNNLDKRNVNAALETNLIRNSGLPETLARSFMTFAATAIKQAPAGIDTWDIDTWKQILQIYGKSCYDAVSNSDQKTTVSTDAYFRFLGKIEDIQRIDECRDNTSELQKEFPFLRPFFIQLHKTSIGTEIGKIYHS